MQEKKSASDTPSLLWGIPQVVNSNGEKLDCKNEAGTKVGPDQLGPPVRVGSTRIDSDQLGSNKKIKIK